MPEKLNDGYLNNELKRLENKIKGDLIKVDIGYINDGFIQDRITVVLIFEA